MHGAWPAGALGRGRGRGQLAAARQLRLAALPDQGLSAVAERILAGLLPVPLRAAERNAIQDALWAGQGAAGIPRKSLYLRLQSSLPADSPPQRNLYLLHHQIHGAAVPGLPALLPEVWLHWDPKTIRDRGPRALRQHRMDFLLLLPHGQRVVLEVDGAHHYADPSGKADPARYAEGARGDRELKLAGYEVFRFGAVELLDLKQARDLLTRFFADLFRRFGVTAQVQGEG